MDAVIIRKINLPIDIKGYTLIDDDGNYNIYLNSRLSSDAQVDAMRHEISKLRKRHIQQVGSL